MVQGRAVANHHNLGLRVAPNQRRIKGRHIQDRIYQRHVDPALRRNHHQRATNVILSEEAE